MSTPLSPRSCLCVHGTTACSASWLAAVRAQMPADHVLVLAGASAALAIEDATRLSTLAAESAESLATALAAQANASCFVLVRSDAELPPFALTRLLDALAEPTVLAAGALDLLDPARSPIPAGMAASVPSARLDALCHACAARRLVDTDGISPLASAWHGEALAGHAPQRRRRVTLDHLFVGSPAAISSTATEPTDPRDPLPPSPFAGLRAALAAMLPTTATPALAGLDGKPVFLHVLHGWGGGAERWVRDFCASHAPANHRVLIARGSHARKRHGEWLELHDGAMDGPALRRIALPVAIADTDERNPAYAALLDEIIRTQSVGAIIVSSLIGHSLDVLRTGLPTVRIVHDHYPLWPVLHRDFGDRTLAFDDAQRERDLTASAHTAVFTRHDAGYWKSLRDACSGALVEARTILVAPSRSALADDLILAPELASLEHAIVPHGLAAWPEPNARLPAPPARERLRLLILGRVRAGKGADLLEHLLPALTPFADVFLLGAGADAHAFFGRGGVHIVLDYARAELPALLATIAADAALLLPTVAETFGYTLSELRSLGLPVIATRIGALAERIEDGVDGFLVEPDAAAIAARVRTIAADRDELARMRATLADRHEPDLADMATGYARVLGSIAAAPRARATLLDLDSQQAAAGATELACSQVRIAALASELAAVQAESARRGDWGHALDRELVGVRAELESRTAWAQALDSELQELKPAYQRIIASRSWRLTAPLRGAAARLRELRTRLAFRKAHVASVLHRLRGSLARNGVGGTLARIRRELGGGAVRTTRVRYAEPSEAFSPFALPVSDSPRVSIVIPVYNKFAYTAACLRSLGEHAGTVPFEVIVVDDGSTDATAQRLAQVGGVRAVRNAENLGFVGSCNAGAALARGEFVLFLNNDTVVTPGWLEALLECFEQETDAGLVGAQLVYPDGRLQEAGGIVFDDASGWNYGRFEDPDDARFAFRREADYCSGAAILVRRALFDRLGGFDTRYAPAYYEDTDLAFAVRAAGFKVFYEPRARVIHFEGISNGTDTGSGLKRYQVVNQAKFRDKWHAALARQPAPGTPIATAATHRARRRVLIVDATTPTPDQDSGSLRMQNLMRVLRANDCHVAFLPSNHAWIERYTPALQGLGVEMLYQPWLVGAVRFFRERGAEFDTIFLSRHYVAREYLGLARLYAPRAKLVFDTVDLHYLREQRAAELENRPELARLAEATRRQEIGLMRECDLTVVVSPVEQAILAHDAPGVTVDVLSNVHEVYGCRAPFGARHDLVFVGGFRHPPNEDAVLWYAREVHPRVRAALPDVTLHVVGSEVTAAVQALAGDGLIVHGFVDDLAPLMDRCRISIAPLRYGAGVKGKVNMAMSYGLPVVATPMAVEGMHVQVGEDVLVAADAEAFAIAVVALYRDEALWNRLSRNGLANVERHFSFAAAETAIRRIVGLPGLGDRQAPSRMP
ncbi:MAG TPA: glycosyltransferase [Dokdonella sp.]|uniref:glycosyltransferase n=1 Tax=Dokdonella sp. TaxID=2291710 RepID=UPI0025C35F82|nr:glycosyltransferase [Dokdonella sp.]MBX3690912.1 glycosyltransferase [Dokdonella sp.]HNR91185.1 glycosyltransferase [Dokdonella sp.]